MGSAIEAAPANRFVLIAEYEGTRYHGFQWQEGLPTIQGEMEQALYRLTGESVRVVAASRTDTGVHARGQVVGFRTGAKHSAKTFIEALNYYLPQDIAVKAAARVGVDFYVRRGALSREYRYLILNSATPSPLRRRYAYRVCQRLNTEAMNQACQRLVGKQDFASFTGRLRDGIRSTVRTVYQAEVWREGDLVLFDMVGDSFLPHQVRNTVGVLVAMGLGKRGVEEMDNILRSRVPSLAGPAAPAHGLCLMKVNYTPFPEVIWEHC